jgi:2,4-dienoyl-CoA reductase-like NADH-dependent reductase (Old Yellow Enzyme family)/thioredoxin reductase
MSSMGKMIYEPITINGMKLKNRIAMAPFVNMPAGEDGNPSEATIKWFESRAKGGVGYIQVGPLGMAPPIVPRPPGVGPRLTIHDEAHIPGFAKLTKVIHSYDCKLGAQVALGGPLLGVGPSVSPFPDELHAKFGMFDMLRGQIIPVAEVTYERMAELIKQQADAAVRIREAGFDCVEYHSTHGGANLPCSFLSPFYNRRKDQYGGSWENRLRYPVETVRAIRKAIGRDFPLLIRLDADELLGKWGITIEDTTQIIVPAIEAAGVDCFDISMGSVTHSPQGININLYYPRGAFIHLPAEVKKVTKLPVIGAGRIVDVDTAEKFLREGKADIIYMGSQLAADPETFKKWVEGRPEDIRVCIGCKTTKGGECGRPCAINYDVQDNPVPLVPAVKPKRVLVVGGGVGGMEAARIASTRGHKVTLFEKTGQLGGIVGALALNPLMAEFGNIVTYESSQLRKLGVDVRLCKEATPASVKELKPDVVIVASGSSLVTPEVAQGKFAVINEVYALRHQMQIGRRVVVWGFPGAELAISLAEQGKDVVLIGGAEASLGSDLPRSRKFWVWRKLTDINAVRESAEAQRVSNPEVIFNCEVEDITSAGVRVSFKGGTKRLLPYDTVIVSRGRKANSDVYDALKGSAAEVYKIGDCVKAADIHEAIWTANEVARKI